MAARILEAFGPGQGPVPGLEGEGLFSEEPGIEAEDRRVLRQDSFHERVIPGVDIPDLEHIRQLLLILLGQHPFQDVPGEHPFGRGQRRPTREQDLADLEEDLAVMAGEERGLLEFLEIGDGGGEGEVGHVEERLGELEVRLQVPGVEPEGPFEAREALLEVGVAAGDVP